MRKTMSLFVAIATLAVSANALAQGNRTSRATGAAPAPAATPVAQHSEYNFPDQDVSGTREGATGVSTAPRRVRHGEGLIRYRSHFVQQMLTTVENF